MAKTINGSTNIKGTRTKDQTFFLYWLIFLSSIIFPPMFLTIDVRAVIALFWLIIAKKYVFPRDLMYLMYILVVYSFLVYAVNFIACEEANINVAIRYIRACVMMFTIYSIFGTTKMTSQKKMTILSSLCYLLSIHAAIIVVEIIYPNVKSFMYIFSGESRIFYQYRANGFVNSYDFAGFYTIIGTILSAFLFEKERQIKYVIFFIICIIATIFTSRTNLIFCCFALIYLLGKLSSKMFLKTIIKVILVCICFSSVVMWAITTDVLAGVRSYLFVKYTWMDSFYILIRNTYPDNVMTDVVSTQFFVNGGRVFQIFGTGTDPNRDPGYVQMLYGIGLIGSLIALFPFLLMYAKLKYFSKSSTRETDHASYIAGSVLGFALVYEILMNIKILFLFSTGAFELLVVLYALLQQKEEDIKNVYQSATLMVMMK